MYSLDMITVADFKDEFLSKVQNVEPEKLIEYCYSINESATESAKTVSNGMRTIFSKLMSNVFDEEEYTGDNALLVDLVVRNILSYLSPKDLCSCRQVCRLWNQEAKVFFRHKQRIVFHPESVKKMDAFIRQMTIEECSEEDSLLLQDDWAGYLRPNNKKYGTNLIPTFTSYCFSAQFQCTQFPRTLMQDFAIICGQYVRKLEIFYPDDGSLNAQDFMAFFITGMPNLESVHFVNLPRKLTQSSFLRQLTVKDVDNLDSKDSTNNTDDRFTRSSSNSLVITNYNCLVKELTSVTQLRIDRTWQMETSWRESFLQDLFLLMPNIQDYELWTWNCTTEDEHSKPYLMSLSQRQKDNIRVLRPGSIGDDLGVHITQLGLKLSKLYLPVLNRNISAKTIELLLQNQQNTLEELQLNCSTMQDSRLVEFPSMSKLKQLHIITTYPWNNDYTVFTPPISYEEQFPSLEVLKLELAIYNDLGFFNYFFPRSSTNKTVCPTLIELDLSFSGFRDEKFISTVSEIFPNLKRLKLDGYGSKIFSSICIYLQNLQQLELYLIYGFNVDDQITGIPKEICCNLRKIFNSKEIDFSKVEDEAVQTSPSLCSLTKLKTLAIRQKDYQAKFWPDAQCISNLSAYYALSQMNQLRHLQIESVKLAPECCNYLRQMLEDCWLDFT